MPGQERWPSCGWRRAAFACLAIGALALAGGQRVLSQAGDPEPLEAPTESEQDLPQVAYQVAFEGVEDSSLRQLLEQVSETQRLIDRPPASLARLRRRARDDRPQLLQALRSRGFYDAEVNIVVASAAEPVKVTFRIDPGPVYRLQSVSIEVDPPAPALDVPTPEEIGLELGEPAAAQTILDAEQALLDRVLAQGFALAEVGPRRAVVDHSTRAMDLTLQIIPGPLARFGPVTIAGLDTTEQAFVANRLDWQQGELITPERLEAARASLRETGLFSTVQILLDTTPDAEGRIPVTVQVTERKHRSIGIGVRYRTDEGPGGSISWEHRNFFGRGEQVSVELDGSFIGASLVGAFRKPDFGRRNQALLADVTLAYDDNDAYKGRSARGRIGLERRLGEGMVVAAGLSFLGQEIEDKATGEGSETFGLLSLPARFEWDTSNDPLDPSEGGRLRVENEPFVDVIGNGLLFNKARVDYARYVEVLQEPQIVLAGRTAVGSLVGESRADIPANLRFYAGGGGSVRGFGYQLAGKLNDHDDPIGGRSLFELSGEVRLRITETIGAVAFVDSGTVFTSTVPDFSETLRVGAGPGLRYFSPIGPLRLDVGFPLNPRNSDDTWQLYISIGQAF